MYRLLLILAILLMPIAAWAETADDHKARGDALFAQEQYQEAIAEYREALRINPFYADAHNNWGQALYNLKRYEEAIWEYKVALQIKPNYADVHINLGSALYNLKQYEAAAQEYKQYLKYAPNGEHANKVRELIRQLRGKTNVQSTPAPTTKELEIN